MLYDTLTLLQIHLLLFFVPDSHQTTPQVSYGGRRSGSLWMSRQTVCFSFLISWTEKLVSNSVKGSVQPNTARESKTQNLHMYVIKHPNLTRHSNQSVSAASIYSQNHSNARTNYFNHWRAVFLCFVSQGRPVRSKFIEF